MKHTLLNAALILILILISGIFVAAEMALVSLRESQIKHLSHRSQRGRRVAELHADPNRFLSTVQIGVTLAGFLSASFGGATLAGDLTPLLRRIGLGPRLADTAALILITIVISYVAIVVGELTAKRLALQRSEAVALVLAPFVNFVATLARPVIWLLGASTNVVVRLIGGDPKISREEVTGEEIRTMISGSTTLGEEERRIVDDVFSAGERGLREVMVPRTEVDFLPGDMPAHRAVREIATSPHSRYPVMGESADDIIGFVHVRDLFNPELSSRTTPIREVARPILSLPDTVKVLRALAEMRRVTAHVAIVLDEYGGTAGIVTMEDLVEELVGDIRDEYDVRATESGPPGQAEVDGLSTLDEFAETTGCELPEGHYDTVAGFVMAQLGRIPQVGDRVEAMVHPVEEPERQVRLELQVTELDGRRIASLRVNRLDAPEPPQLADAAPEGPELPADGPVTREIASG